MHRRRGGRDDLGGRGEDGFGPAPVVGERARWWSALVGAAGDSERHVVAVEEVELPVVARAFGMARFAEFVVVASDLSEVLAIEDDGEVVEALGDESGGLVAELVVHDEVRQVHSRNSATACSRCSAVTVRALPSAAAVRA